jgi:hypothetical protein
LWRTLGAPQNFEISVAHATPCATEGQTDMCHKILHQILLRISVDASQNFAPDYAAHLLIRATEMYFLFSIFSFLQYI